MGLRDSIRGLFGNSSTGPRDSSTPDDPKTTNEPLAPARVQEVATGPPTSVAVMSDYTLDDLVFTVVDAPEFVSPTNDITKAYALEEFTDQVHEAIAGSFDSIDKVMLLGERDGNGDLMSGPTKGFVYKGDEFIPFLLQAPYLGEWFALTTDPGKHCLVGRTSDGLDELGKYSQGAWDTSRFDDLTTLLRKGDPRYDPAGLKRPKDDDSLARAELLASADDHERASVDGAAVAAAWQALVDLGELEPRKPATDAEIAVFEDAAGFALPDELKALYRRANGATNAFGIYVDLMPLDRLVATWDECNQIFDEWDLDELRQSGGAADDRVIGIYTTPRWIPFTDESTGNHYAIDLLPGPAGRKGQIIYFGADESNRVRCIADDLVDFLRRELAWQTSDKPDANAKWYATW